MPVVIDESEKLYEPLTFSEETSFEEAVVRLSDHIFGESSIYVDVKRQIRGKDFVTIPDGYVIDMAEPGTPRLFVLENEIVSHDPFRHIGVQMLKFVTSFEDARPSVRNFLMEEIHGDDESLRRLDRGCEQSATRNIDAYLDRAVFREFRGLVVIDEAVSELHRVLEKINADISVLELKCYKAEDGTEIYQFDTLYEEHEDVSSRAGEEGRSERLTSAVRAARRRRRAECDTIVVPARERGFKETFLGEDQWYQIRIGAAMKDRLEYIAAYQTAPVSAVTHIARIGDIRPYEDTGKYRVIFEGSAEEIDPVPIRNGNRAPQGPVYVKRGELLEAEALEDALDT